MKNKFCNFRYRGSINLSQKKNLISLIIIILGIYFTNFFCKSFSGVWIWAVKGSLLFFFHAHVAKSKGTIVPNCLQIKPSQKFKIMKNIIDDSLCINIYCNKAYTEDKQDNNKIRMF